MSNGTATETGGMNWAALIPEMIELVKTGVGVASASTTNCGKLCRQKCRQETGWLFSGRGKCKKKCKADCFAKQNEPPQIPPNPVPMIIMSVIILLAIGGIIWWIVKKK